MVDQYENYGDEIKEESILNAATGDQPCLDDSLGFSPYVEAIKDFLINPSTKPPLTLSIEGPWGSGKSSFMMQLKKKLEDNGEYTVLFNSWRHDKEDTMWAAFALEFIRQLSRDLSIFQRIEAEYKLLRARLRWKNKREDILKIVALFILIFIYLSFFYSKGFDWIHSLPVQFVILSYLGAGYAFYKAISSFVLDLKELFGNSIYANLKKCIKTPDYENRTTFIEEFHGDFKNIVECYAKRRKVFVFIDDLDRCEVPKAADLMQALNLMISNDPHLIFVIGMDRLKVASGFAVKYEKLFPYLQSSKNYGTLTIQNGNYYKGLEYGYEFLEKFIQLPVQVPQPEISDLQKFVYDENGDTTEEQKSNPEIRSNSLQWLTQKAEFFYNKRRMYFGKNKIIDQKQKPILEDANISKPKNPSKQETVPKKIIAIFPVFNEEHIIADVIESCKKYVDRVVIVDDGSADNTVNIAESLGAYIVHHETNKGYVAALKTSLKTAADFGADIVVIMDLASWEDSPGISKFVDPIFKDEADIVIGIAHQNGLDKSAPIYRWIESLILDIFNKWDSGRVSLNSNNTLRCLATTKEIFLFDTQDMDINKMLEGAIKANLRIKKVEIGDYDFGYPLKLNIQENSETDSAIKQLEEKQKTLIERVKVTVSSDSPTVRQILRMVLPALDYNPRRIKQFLNLFRLKTFIASETGLFCISESTFSESNLTLEKLGKFIAISLKWPLLLSDINLNPKLLDELQKISLEKEVNIKKISDEAKYWISQEKLIDLLQYGCLNNDGSINHECEKIFSLSDINLRKLLQTSPRIDRATILTNFEIKTKILKTNFQDISDKKQAWLSLHRLVYDEDDEIRWRAAKAVGNAYKYLSEKEEALKDLDILTSDNGEFVRVYANHSLGKISIFEAAQAEKEEDYKKELEKAIAFFEKATQESLGKSFNPSQFCLPFYRSFYTIIFKKSEAKEEVDKYLAEVKSTIEGSKRKKLLYEAVENLAEALKEVQNLGSLDLQTMKGELSLYKKHCDHAAELMKDVDEKTPYAAGVLIKGLHIFDKNLKSLIEEIKEKAKIAYQESQGTPTEGIARAVRSEVQKWEIGSQEEMAQSVENLISSLKSKIPNIPENQKIFDKIDSLNNEKDITRQYENLFVIISLIPQITTKTTIDSERMKPTIGIITALPKEYIAVNILLDNKNDKYKIPGSGAGSRYCLGEIISESGNKHNIVLATVGKGNNIAATRASLLLEHFPNVKSIIMVGIAVGVPNPNNVDDQVRLGDIVVSTENGVIQYDLIKQEIQEITHRNPPRPPSASLMEAVRYLEAGEILGNRPWEKYIAQSLSQLKINRPPEDKDVLYSFDDRKRPIKHPEDPKRIKDQPRVFIGSIASANILQKDPKAIDELREKFGVKAVEMEASGIADATWNHEVGYLVVRGICDYCDSHKNDEWQQYAAVVAAAYTRALIESMP